MTFFGKTGSNMEFTSMNFHFSHVKSCSPQINICVNIFSARIYLSNDVSCASNGDSMPKLRTREVETPIYPNGAHSFGTTSPRVRVLDV